MNRTKIVLSNDAFYLLKDGEEPLDEENISEAEDIRRRFPQGFEIEDGWTSLADSGQIEAVFLSPSQEERYDSEMEIVKGVCYQIKWTDESHVKMRCNNSLKGTCNYYGEYEVQTNKYGRKYFQVGDVSIGKGCIFFINDFNDTCH